MNKEIDLAMSETKWLSPNLRFPDFEPLGIWDYIPISEIGETINGLTGKKGDDFGKGKPYIQYKQVFDKSQIDISDCGKVEIGENENQNSVKKGDIFFTTSSETPYEVGYASVLLEQPEEEIYLNSFCFILRPFNLEFIIPNFSRYLFHSPIFRNSVITIAQGSTRFNISKNTFRNLKVPIPKKIEQQKIATCLTSLDDLITAHTQKLEALKDHKKGLLQNLFPQEGETVPRLRFPEFEGDGEWVENKLEKLTEKIGDGIHMTPKYDDSGNYFFINGNNLLNGKIYVDEKTKKVSQQEYMKHKKELKETTVLLSINGTIGNVAFCNNKGVILGKSVCHITPNHELSSLFLYYTLQSPKITRYFLSELTGTTIKNLSLRTIRETILSLPTIKEQKKIAHCLSAVVDLTTAQAEKIEQLQQHKKGLMQGLFPSPSVCHSGFDPESPKRGQPISINPQA
jgi:type I restriction enzyme S subunit